jgi:hypothetical protein
VRMTVEERDQWECLLADWSAAYDITRSEDDELPFKAVPHADREALLEAASPRLLRGMVRADHARRTAAEAAREGMMTTAADVTAPQGGEL